MGRYTNRITLEHNGKTQRRPGRENGFIWMNGGQDGIRTHETLLGPTPLAGERLRPLGHLPTAGYLAQLGSVNSRKVAGLTIRRACVATTRAKGHL